MEKSRGTVDEVVLGSCPVGYGRTLEDVLVSLSTTFVGVRLYNIDVCVSVFKTIISVSLANVTTFGSYYSCQLQT
jgi:hypothetical protein